MWHYAERPCKGRSFLVREPAPWLRPSQAAQCPPAVFTPLNDSAPLNLDQLKP